MDDNNMDNQTAEQNSDQDQGLMGNVQAAQPESSDVNETEIPHLETEEEVEGDDDGLYVRPEFIPEKFWDEQEGPDIEGMMKSLGELEKKFHRGDHKVPEQYNLDVLSEYNVPEDDALLTGFVSWAKANNVSQKGFDDIVGQFVGMSGDAVQQQQVNRADELKALGPNADAIIQGNKDWMDGLERKGIISADDLKELYFLGDVAAGQKVISKLRQMTGDMTPIPTTPTAEGRMSQQEFKEHAAVLMADPKYGSDPVYTRNVEKEFNEYYGT